MKKALVHIKDSHFSDGEKTCCELTSSGFFGCENGIYSVSYEETDEELAGCTTTLKVDAPEKITMIRSGRYNTEMVFETDRRHTCFYSTPFGELMMGVYAKSVFSELNENGGRVRFIYTIDFNNDLISENDLEIFVELKEEE